MKHKLALIIFFVFFAAFFLLTRVYAQEESKSAPTGSLSCKDCHEEENDSYFKSPHGNKFDSRSPEGKLGCETCHGNGAKHIEADGQSFEGLNLFGPRIQSEKKNEICLQCHSGGNRALWEGSVHESKNLSCTDCHSIHKGNSWLLAKPSEIATCTQCHKQIEMDLRKFSHHPIREGKLQCTDCHNPHGTVTDKLVSADSINEKCYECHAEKRGPFLWEHAPVRENCLTCHTPHGSAHDKLLVEKRPYLCQRCHDSSRHPGALYALSTAQAGQSVYLLSNSRLFYRSCDNCHSLIHGSNSPSGHAFQR